MIVSMSNEQRLKAEGMDKLLRKFNKYPDDKTIYCRGDHKSL